MLKPILLIEDNPHDLELTLVALERSQLANDVIVLRDGLVVLGDGEVIGLRCGDADELGHHLLHQHLGVAARARHARSRRPAEALQKHHSTLTHGSLRFTVAI